MIAYGIKYWVGKLLYLRKCRACGTHWVVKPWQGWFRFRCPKPETGEYCVCEGGENADRD